MPCDSFTFLFSDFARLCQCSFFGESLQVISSTSTASDRGFKLVDLQAQTACMPTLDLGSCLSAFNILWISFWVSVPNFLLQRLLAPKSVLREDVCSRCRSHGISYIRRQRLTRGHNVWHKACHDLIPWLIGFPSLLTVRCNIMPSGFETLDSILTFWRCSKSYTVPAIAPFCHMLLIVWNHSCFRHVAFAFVLFRLNASPSVNAFWKIKGPLELVFCLAEMSNSVNVIPILVLLNGCSQDT